MKNLKIPLSREDDSPLGWNYINTVSALIRENRQDLIDSGDYLTLVLFGWKNSESHSEERMKTVKRIIKGT